MDEGGQTVLLTQNLPEPPSEGVIEGEFYNPGGDDSTGYDRRPLVISGGTSDRHGYSPVATTAGAADNMRLEIQGDYPGPQGLTEPPTPEERKLLVLATVVKVVVVASLTFAGFFCAFNQAKVTRWLERFLATIASMGYWGPVVFSGAYGILMALFFPGELMTLSAGFVFTDDETLGFKVGFPIAVAACFAGQLLSAVIDWVVARTLFMETFRGRFEAFRVYRAFVRAVKDGGVKVVFLIRLSPFVPFAITNFIFGLVDLELMPVIVGAFGAIPVIAALVYLGSALNDITAINHAHWKMDALHISLATLGVVAALAGLLYMVVLTKKKLKEEEQEEALRNEVSFNLARQSTKNFYTDSPRILQSGYGGQQAATPFLR